MSMTVGNIASYDFRQQIQPNAVPVAGVPPQFSGAAGDVVDLNSASVKPVENDSFLSRHCGKLTLGVIAAVAITLAFPKVRFNARNIFGSKGLSVVTDGEAKTVLEKLKGIAGFDAAADKMSSWNLKRIAAYMKEHPDAYKEILAGKVALKGQDGMTALVGEIKSPEQLYRAVADNREIAAFLTKRDTKELYTQIVFSKKEGNKIQWFKKLTSDKILSNVGKDAELDDMPRLIRHYFIKNPKEKTVSITRHS